MAANNYHFITYWKVKASCEEVYEILSAAETLPMWWPSVYLDVKIVEQGNANDIGKKVSLYTKGWLPYTLRWHFVVTENTRPFGFTIKAFGDFEGTGVWKFEQHGAYCLITFDWSLKAEKEFLKKLSFILKPVFKANHLWAMRKGEESLKLELLRRNSATEYEIQAIPLPPKPTFPHNITNNKILR